MEYNDGIAAVFDEMRQYGDPAASDYRMPFTTGQLRERGLGHHVAVSIHNIFVRQNLDIRQRVLNREITPRNGYECIRKLEGENKYHKKSNDPEFDAYTKETKALVDKIEAIPQVCAIIREYNKCECGRVWYSRCFERPEVCPFCRKEYPLED